MRLSAWPQSLFGRLLAASVAAVLVAQAAGLLLIAQERERFVLQGSVRARAGVRGRGECDTGARAAGDRGAGAVLRSARARDPPGQCAPLRRERASGGRRGAAGPGDAPAGGGTAAAASVRQPGAAAADP